MAKRFQRQWTLELRVLGVNDQHKEAETMMRTLYAVVDQYTKRAGVDGQSVLYTDNHDALGRIGDSPDL